jgi:thioredoxin 1
MATFGEVITSTVPVGIVFYTEWHEQSIAGRDELNKLFDENGCDKVKKINIDVDKNEMLADALRIKGLPTVMVYKDGQMVFRMSGDIDKDKVRDAIF